MLDDKVVALASTRGLNCLGNIFSASLSGIGICGFVKHEVLRQEDAGPITPRLSPPDKYYVGHEPHLADLMHIDCSPHPSLCDVVKASTAHSTNNSNANITEHMMNENKNNKSSQQALD